MFDKCMKNVTEFFFLLLLTMRVEQENTRIKTHKKIFYDYKMEKEMHERKIHLDGIGGSFFAFLFIVLGRGC